MAQSDPDCLFCKIIAGELPAVFVAEADLIDCITAARAAAWQSVFHFHVHVIPRYGGDPLRGS